MKLKRLFSILGMAVAVAMLAPCAVNAKTTTKKKTSTTASAPRATVSKAFGATTLIQKGTYSNGFASNIESTLLRMGFSQSGSVYSRDGISIDTSDPLKMMVTFPNYEERDKFIEGTKSLGYQWDGTKCINGRQLSLDIAVDGDTISIYFPD